MKMVEREREGRVRERGEERISKMKCVIKMYCETIAM